MGLTGEQDRGKPGRIIVRDPSTVGDAVLDAALGIVIAHRGQWPSTAEIAEGNWASEAVRKAIEEMMAAIVAAATAATAGAAG